jgi:hypothetical protein
MMRLPFPHPSNLSAWFAQPAEGARAKGPAARPARDQRFPCGHLASQPQLRPEPYPSGRFLFSVKTCHPP